jgi:predicted flap endonuclease-1-like 5' DNA nuclease
VAWFIGQSAVMILLAFLLGLLVGWIIWGRRVRTLLIEIRDLRAAVADCEAHHGDRARDDADRTDRTDQTDATDAAAPAATVRIPAPRTEVPDAAVLETSSGSRSGGLDAADPDAADPDAGDVVDTDDADLDDDDLDDDDRDDTDLDAGPDDVDLDVDPDDVDETDHAVAELDALDVYAGGESEPASLNGNGPGHVVTLPTAVSDERAAVADESTGAASGGLDEPADDVTADGLTAESVTAGGGVADGTGGNDPVPADDLVRIEGIGPKIAAALVAAGIRTYRSLAEADDETLTTAINNAGIRFAPSLVTWAEQAQLLADGDEAAFLALTDRLIAGRDVAKTAKGEDVPPPPPDDLARIEGIGPKIAAALVAAGIRTFQQLAASDDETLTKAIAAAGISFAPSLVTWAEQAQLLADGDEDAFAVLTARLIAGRRADDDLERIEGIGPKMAGALHAAGIRTYRALADSSETRLRNAISGAGLTFAPSIVTWSRQAGLLADGDEDGFADLTRRLVAGRDEGRA